MITNKEQYNNEIKRYKILLKKIEEYKEKVKKNLKNIYINSQYDIFKSQLQEVEKEIKEYEDLTSGERPFIGVYSIDELPKAIIKYRIINGLSEKEFGKRFAVSENNIKKWERNEYRRVPFERIAQIVAKINNGIYLRFEKGIEKKVKQSFNKRDKDKSR